MLHELSGEVGLGEGASADTDEADLALLYLAGPDVEEVLLQPTIAAADAGEVGLT